MLRVLLSMVLLGFGVGFVRAQDDELVPFLVGEKDAFAVRECGQCGKHFFVANTR